MELLTPRWSQPPRRFHRDQHDIRKSNARVKVMDCGRRSGKTLLACEMLVSRLLDVIPHCPEPRYACGAPIQEQANEIFWDLLLELIPEEWIIGGRNGDNVRISTRKIHLANGAVIKVAGLDKPHRIEGRYLNGFVGTEISDCKPNFFDRTVWPMLGDYHGWAILEGVPKRQGIGARWFRQLCERIANGEEPDSIRRNWPAWSIVDPQEIEEAKRRLSVEDFQEQYGAQWLNAGGSVFHSFSREHNVRPCVYRPELPIIVGQDYNWNPMSWCMSHKIGDTLETFDELVLNNVDTARALNVLWSRYEHHKSGWQFYGDASGKSHTSNSPISDYAIVNNDQRFIKAGRTLHYPPANPSRRDRFAAANARLCTADGLHHAFIDPKCAKLIEDMEMRAYKPGTTELPEKEGMLGHSSDAWSYVIIKLWPIRFNVNEHDNKVVTSKGPAISYPSYANGSPIRPALDLSKLR
jgi:hypothetical protein